MELASPSTFRRDFTEKKEIYEKILRVKEYYIYDPYGEIEPAFIGFRLLGEAYQEIAFVEERLPSDVLGLELGEHDGMLRLYSCVLGAWLEPSRDRVDKAEARATAEARARQEAETELAKALAALKRLQTPE